MHKIRNFILFCLVALLISGCKMAVLNPDGTIALGEKELFLTALGLMLVVVIPVIIMNFVFAWHFRAKNTKAKYNPDFHHSTILEVFCWGIPIIIIGALAVITWISAHRYDPYRPLNSTTKPLVIQVIALDWKWLFIYPQQNIATVNYVQMPVNTPVRFYITADAPMNSFLIPQLAGQIYAMPGMKTQLNIFATQVGNYRGFSANYSGVGFAKMTFDAKVTSEKEFATWVSKVQNQPGQLTNQIYAKLAKPSVTPHPVCYSKVASNLFGNVIMKFMMPMPQKVTP